jgi:DNA-directed RNA polymerase specialized sigma24 family protein
MPDGILAHALGQTGAEPVAEAVTELCDSLTEMINTSEPRNRAVMRLTVNGWTQSEIADLMDIKVGDVENARYAFRSKVRTQLQRGHLHIPPEIRAEWARTKKAAGR